MARIALHAFELANPVYAGATVNVYGIDGSGAKDTANPVTLYTAKTGSGSMVNPQTLDRHGMWPVVPYVEESCILEISGPHVADHDTGVITV